MTPDTRPPLVASVLTAQFSMMTAPLAMAALAIALDANVGSARPSDAV